MKVVFVISSLAGGGAARALVLVAGALAEQGWRVEIVSLDDPSSDAYEVPPGVDRTGLGVYRPAPGPVAKVRDNLARGWRLRRALRAGDPDAVVGVGTRTNVLVAAATRGLGRPVAVWEQNDPRRVELPRFWRGLRRAAYPGLDRLVVLVERLRPWAARHVEASRIEAIPNPAPPHPLPGAGQGHRVLPDDAPRVVSVASLTRQKGLDRLVDAFARSTRAYPAWKLTIVGEGPERGRLAALARQHGIGDRLEMPGHVGDVGAYLDAADVFALASRYEGFPNALLEAMAAGVPPVSFDCPCGPAEIIRHDVDGLLVAPDDVEAFAAALGRLMASPELRRKLGERAVDVARRFDVEEIAARWQRLIGAMAAGAPAA